MNRSASMPKSSVVSKKQPGSRRSPERAQDSWGGHSVILLLASVLGYPVVGRLFDSARLEIDSLGRAEIVQDGRINTVFGVGFFVAAVVAASMAAWSARASGRGSPFSFFIQLLVLWWVLLSVLIPRKSNLDVPDLVILGAIPLALGVVSSPPTLVTARRVNFFRDIFAVGHFVYPFFAPNTARLPCREDKCGIFGHLDTGFYTQENTGIAAISLLLPLAGVSSYRRLAFSSTIALLIALASGSRTGLTSVVAATAVAVYVRFLFRNGGPTASVSWVVLLAPIAATLVSLGLFLFSDPTTLTGRGAVYAGNLNALNGPSLLYGVPWDTVEIATGGYLDSDHGQTSHILAKAGLVGLILWLLALVMPLRQRRYGIEQTLGLAILAAGASRMLTESTFELEARSSGFMALLLVTGYVANPSSSVDAPGWPTSRTVSARLVVVGVTAAILAAIPWIMPSSYRAATVLAVTVPTFSSTSGEESSTARLQAAAATEFLAVDSGALQSAMRKSGMDPALAGSYSVVAPRGIQSTTLRLTTTGPDEATAREVNDAMGRYLVVGIGSESPRYGVQLRQMGQSTATRISPWTVHLEVMVMAVAIGVAAFLLVGRISGENRRARSTLRRSRMPIQ